MSIPPRHELYAPLIIVDDVLPAMRRPSNDAASDPDPLLPFLQATITEPLPTTRLPRSPQPPSPSKKSAQTEGNVLEVWLASKGFAIGPSSSASGMPREAREQRLARRQAQAEQRQRDQAAQLSHALQR